MTQLLAKSLCVILFICLVTEVKAQQKPIVLVSSNALTGPTSGLGIKLTQGAEIYFNKINAQGGIAERKIKLRTLDDHYVPFQTVNNTYKAIDSNDFLALFNYVGTPNAHAILPIITKHKIPFITPFTGAEFLRTPTTPYIFNLRASYYQEATAQIDYLISKVNAKNIALLVQSDKFGTEVENGYLLAMQKYNIKPVVTTRFRRNTDDIEQALAIMIDHDVDAVAFVGTYSPMIELITQAYQQNFRPFFSSVSFVSSHDLFAGVKVPANILVTEVTPEPRRCQLAVCQEFLEDIAKYKNIQPGQVVFEGYLNAKLFVEVATLCQHSLTRDCIIQKLAHFESEFGGLQVKFTPSQHQGLHNVYLSLFNNKSIDLQ